jgi:hypothetical protein
LGVVDQLVVEELEILEVDAVADIQEQVVVDQLEDVVDSLDTDMVDVVQPVVDLIYLISL